MTLSFAPIRRSALLFRRLLKISVFGHLERPNEKVAENGLVFFGQIGLVGVLEDQIHKYRLGQICNLTLQVLYFLKGNDKRTSKIMFLSVWHANTQIQEYTSLLLHRVDAIS